jgi:hypothetical protein
MSQKNCEFCDVRGDFAGCACQYREVLGCGGKATCASCAKSHRTFGIFFRALLKTQPATRSNSPRTKLLQILHTTIVFRRSSIRQQEFCLDSLRRTSPFDTDSENFRGQVVRVAQSLPLNQDLASTLERNAAETATVQAIEKLDECWRGIVARKEEKKGIESALEQFARVVAITSR